MNKFYLNGSEISFEQIKTNAESEGLSVEDYMKSSKITSEAMKPNEEQGVVEQPKVKKVDAFDSSKYHITADDIAQEEGKVATSLTEKLSRVGLKIKEDFTTPFNEFGTSLDAITLSKINESNEEVNYNTASISDQVKEYKENNVTIPVNNSDSIEERVKKVNDFIDANADSSFFEKAKENNPQAVDDIVNDFSKHIPTLKAAKQGLINERLDFLEEINNQETYYNSATGSGDARFGGGFTFKGTPEQKELYKKYKEGKPLPEFTEEEILENKNKIINSNADKWMSEYISDLPEDKKTEVLSILYDTKESYLKDSEKLNKLRDNANKRYEYIDDLDSELEASYPGLSEGKKDFNPSEILDIENKLKIRNKEVSAYLTQQQKIDEIGIAIGAEKNEFYLPLAIRNFEKNYSRIEQTQSSFKAMGAKALYGIADIYRLGGFGSGIVMPRSVLKPLAQLNDDLGEELEGYQYTIPVDQISSAKDLSRWLMSSAINTGTSLSMAAAGGPAALPLFFTIGFGEVGSSYHIERDKAEARLYEYEDILKSGGTLDEQQLEQFNEDNRILGLSELQVVTSSVIAGAIEVGTEQLTTIKLLSGIKTGITQVAKKDLKLAGREIFKGVTLEPGGEVVVELVNNWTDINILGEDKSYFEGVKETFFQSLLPGGGFAIKNAAPFVNNVIVNNFSDRKQAKRLIEIENKIKELNPENKQRSRLSPGVRALVDDLLQENKGIRNDIYAKLRNNELTSKDIADLGRADIKMRKIQREVTAAANDPSLTLSEKKQIKDENKKEFDKQSNIRESILNSDPLSDTEKNKIQKETIDQFNFINKQLSGDAFDRLNIEYNLLGKLKKQQVNQDIIDNFSDENKLIYERASDEQKEIILGQTYIESKLTEEFDLNSQNAEKMLDVLNEELGTDIKVYYVSQEKRLQESSEEGGTTQEIIERAFNNVLSDLSQDIVDENGNQIRYENQSKEQKAQTKENYSTYQRSFGFFGGEVGNVFINKETSIEGGAVSVVLHEIIHAYFSKKEGQLSESLSKTTTLKESFDQTEGRNLLAYLKKEQPDLYAQVTREFEIVKEARDRQFEEARKESNSGAIELYKKRYSLDKEVMSVLSDVILGAKRNVPKSIRKSITDLVNNLMPKKFKDTKFGNFFKPTDSEALFDFIIDFNNRVSSDNNFYNQVSAKSAFDKAEKVKKEITNKTINENLESTNKIISELTKQTTDNLNKFYEDGAGSSDIIFDVANELITTKVIDKQGNVKIVPGDGLIGKLVDRRTGVPLFKDNREQIIFEAAYGGNVRGEGRNKEGRNANTGIPDLIKTYDPNNEAGMSFAAYVYKLLPLRVNGIANHYLKAGSDAYSLSLSEEGNEFLAGSSEALMTTQDDISQSSEDVVNEQERVERLLDPRDLIADKELKNKATNVILDNFEDIADDPLSFKSLPDLSTETTAEIFQIPSKKLIPKNNFTQGELKNTMRNLDDMFDDFIKIFPKGAVVDKAVTQDLYGTSTGLPTNVLTSFYRKGDRIDTASGLPIYDLTAVTKEQFRQELGILPDGTIPDKVFVQSPQAQVAKGLAIMFGKLITNTTVRQHLKTLSGKEQLTADIAAGKSENMLSIVTNKTKKYFDKTHTPVEYLSYVTSVVNTISSYMIPNEEINEYTTNVDANNFENRFKAAKKIYLNYVNENIKSKNKSTNTLEKLRLLNEDDLDIIISKKQKTKIKKLVKKNYVKRGTSYKALAWEDILSTAVFEQKNSKFVILEEGTTGYDSTSPDLQVKVTLPVPDKDGKTKEKEFIIFFEAKLTTGARLGSLGSTTVKLLDEQLEYSSLSGGENKSIEQSIKESKKDINDAYIKLIKFISERHEGFNTIGSIGKKGEPNSNKLNEETYELAKDEGLVKETDFTFYTDINEMSDKYNDKNNYFIEIKDKGLYFIGKNKADNIFNLPELKKKNGQYVKIGVRTNISKGDTDTNGFFNLRIRSQFVLGKGQRLKKSDYTLNDIAGLMEKMSNNLIENNKGRPIQPSENLESLDTRFNGIIEETKGGKTVLAAADKVIPEVIARQKGASIGKYKLYVPPSAEDFMGLMYSFMGKGAQGDLHKQFFEETLNKPYKRGIAQLESAKQKMENDYKDLRKKHPEVVKKLNKKMPGTDFTYDQAIRIFLWKSGGFDMAETGLEPETAEGRKLINDAFFAVAKDRELQQFARGVGLMSGQEKGWIDPSRDWVIDNIASDLNSISDKIGRKQFLQEFTDNYKEIFNKQNLNKIEAIYGSRFRNSLEDILFRMEKGTNRNFGSEDARANAFADFLNGSVGSIMFFNMRSAALQTLSAANYVNWSDNNIYAAGKAFANVPQYYADVVTLFNSDKLKQRRKGFKMDVNQAELVRSIEGQKDGFKAALRYLLKLGFTPTQAVDSLAIATGGATFYRNRINTYIKDNGLTKEEAEAKAFEDFSEITDQSQQSSDPAMVSEQQANKFSRWVLSFQNTSMQYNRLIKKAALDIANNRGNTKENVSKILYYSFVQNFTFNALSSALFAVALGSSDDDEKDKQKILRTANGMADTILKGAGYHGAIIAMLKNTVFEIHKQESKSWGKDYTYVLLSMLNVAPAVGSKFSKGYKVQKTYEFQKDLIKERGFYPGTLNPRKFGKKESIGLRGSKNIIDNPAYMMAGYALSVVNIPLDRVIKKVSNASYALDNTTKGWQKTALMFGFSTWDLDLKNSDGLLIKERAQDQRKEAGYKKAAATRKKNSKTKKRSVVEEIEYKNSYEYIKKKQDANRKKILEANN